MSLHSEKLSMFSDDQKVYSISAVSTAEIGRKYFHQAQMTRVRNTA